MIEYLCKDCGRSFVRYNSLQRLCGLCAYNKQAKPRKPMKRIGKVTKKWIETRKEWIDSNPPVDGYWTCYLQIHPLCPKRMTIDELTLDHKQSRGRHPELRYEMSNLAPACSACNALKGSRDIDEL